MVLSLSGGYSSSPPQISIEVVSRQSKFNSIYDSYVY